MANPESETPLGLKQKLLLIRRGLKTLPKRGWNDHHKYKYVRAEDAVGKAQRLLDRYGVLLKPAVAGPPIFQGTTTYVPMVYVFEDVETGEAEAVHWLGAGQDKGDKGTYKAYTGALKFFLINFFQVQVGDAPEPEATDADGASTTRPRQEKETTVDKDADRPAAPRIPKDRAKAIADAAVAAELASWDQDGDKPKLVMTPVLKARLAQLSVAQIGALNVDQAEAVEAFIAEEAKG